MQITLEVPDHLGKKLQQLGDRLPDTLALLLQDLPTTAATTNQSDRQIIEFLASQPSPEAIIAMRPAPDLQSRMSELLERNKAGNLSRQEETELDRYLLLEHWVRLAKANAYKKLKASA